MQYRSFPDIVETQVIMIFSVLSPILKTLVWEISPLRGIKYYS